MSCCGKKRQALSTAGPLRRPAPAPEPADLLNPQPLRHRSDYSLVVRGPATGQTYLFGGRASALAVDERDVAPMIASGRFVPA
jgi:hypothetical protein